MLLSDAGVMTEDALMNHITFLADDSLYGNNESLLFEPGDWVQPGQSIGTVGANPGDEQGLYFELRNHGEAIDPANWINRR